MTKRIATAALLWLALGHAAPAEDASAIAARLQRVDAATSLDALTVAPWHMKMSIQLFDPHGKPTEPGTIEEWWASPQQYRVTWFTPSYKATDLQTSTGFYRTKAAEQPPWLLEQLLEQVVHPMPPPRDTEGTLPEARKEKFGKSTFNCIVLARAIKAKVFLPIGVFPTYCIDPAANALRAVYDYGSQLILRNDIEPFAGRSVTRDINITRNNKSTATARVFRLEAFTADEATFLPHEGLEPVEHPLRLGAATIGAALTTMVKPIYPENATDKAGMVILQLIIARDGHIAFTRFITSPAPELGAAAMTAVKQWVYKPYLLEGKPVEVETTTFVNFTGGGG